MTTSLTPNVTEELGRTPMSRRAIVFFRERLRSVIHERVFREFRRLEHEKKITKRDLSRRLDKDPSVMTRTLGAPGNWTLDTISDLLLGMGLGLTVDVEDLTTAPRVIPVAPGISDHVGDRQPGVDNPESGKNARSKVSHLPYGAGKPDRQAPRPRPVAMPSIGGQEPRRAFGS